MEILIKLFPLKPFPFLILLGKYQFIILVRKSSLFVQPITVKHLPQQKRVKSRCCSRKHGF